MYSEAQNKATQQYKKAHYKRIPLDVPTLEYQKIKLHCASHNLKVNGYIRSLINADLEAPKAKRNRDFTAETLNLTSEQFDMIKENAERLGYSVRGWLHESCVRLIKAWNEPDEESE